MLLPGPTVTAATDFFIGLPMNSARFAGHNEAREALVLSIAVVTAISLIESLIFLILY
jgi:hypothetical protein